MIPAFEMELGKKNKYCHNSFQDSLCHWCDLLPSYNKEIVTRKEHIKKRGGECWGGILEGGKQVAWKGTAIIQCCQLSDLFHIRKSLSL